MTLVNFKKFVVLSAAVTVTVAASAQAQNAASGDVATLEEIVVTAQRRNESLQDVPIAITVATKEQIKRDQIYSLTDLQRITPALEISQTFGGDNTGGGRIRGVGTNVFNQTATGSVAIVVDQVPQGNASFPQLFDLAQVEVLRGPQGTLFGQTASAGVINMTTAAPDPAAFAVSVGTDFADKGTGGAKFGQTIVRGVLNAPINGTSALRLATFYKSETGVQRNVYLGRDNKISDLSARLRYLVQPSDKLTLNFMAEYNKNKKDGVNFFVMSLAPAGFANSAASLANQTACGLTVSDSAQQYCTERQPDESVKNYGANVVVDWSGDKVDFTSVTGYRFKNRHQVYLNYSRQVGVPQASDQRIDNFSNQLSQELRVSSKGDGPLTYTAGLFYSRFAYRTTPTEAVPYGVPASQVGFSVCNFAGTICPVPVEFREAHVVVKAQAAFADLTYDLSQQFSVFGGLRYTKQDIDFSYVVLGAISAMAPNGVLFAPAPGKAKDSNLSGRIGARYRFNPAAMIYASAATGFKGTLVDVTVPANPSIVLKPEEPTAYELGAKFSLLNNRLAVDANIYHSDIKNFQAQENTFVGTALISIPVGISKLTSKGFEVDVVGSLTEHLRLNAGYMFNDTKYPSTFWGDDPRAAPYTGVGGKQFISSPKNKLALSGEYDWGWTANKNGFFNLNAVYKSEIRLAARSPSTYLFPAHTTIGASVGIRSADEKWTVSLFGRNITDEHEPVAYLASTFAGQLDGAVRAWPDSTTSLRLVGLSADFKF
jgi:outer membrane receptor protein involved in Fe transport